jgi:DNA-binding winged helix-turn-helix (wHTH) protein
VSREELQKRLWTDDAYVDSTNGLTAAVNKLRDALGDSAEEPRYIETLARRGYRFIGTIQSELSQPLQPASIPVTPVVAIPIALVREKARALPAPACPNTLQLLSVRLALGETAPSRASGRRLSSLTPI